MTEVVKIEGSGPIFPNSGSQHHLPTYFRGWCQTASSGGAQSYRWVGRSLLKALAMECPMELEEDEWFQCIETLDDLFASSSSDDEILEWYKEYLPRFVELIPQRRRAIFVEGMRELHNEEGIEI